MAFKALCILFFLGAAFHSGDCVESLMRQEASLNVEQTYILGWEVDGYNSRIIFDVIVKTTGWVGFGLAPKASMKGADLIMGGVNDDGTTYLVDYNSADMGRPSVDTHQDYVLENAVQNATHTYLKFSRVLDTCDTDDLAINGDTLNVIWSYGESDDVTAKHVLRGGRQFNLLDPAEPFFDKENLEVWEVRVEDELPADETTYLCTIHKLKKFQTKHYIVALEAYLGDQDAVRHTHHFTATACNQDDPEVLAKLVELEQEGKGQSCYSGVYGALKAKCNAILFGWAVGGKRIVLPDHLGVTVGDEKDQDKEQYVMFEVHYDNPDLKAGLKFPTGFNLFFSSEARENEGSVFMVGTNILPSLLIPPKADEFVLSGHCSSEYTREFLPKDGINVVSVNMHSHLAGRKLKVRHFRDGTELAPLLSDDNYDFDYQQTRELPEEVKILPGDHLTMECYMQTSERDYVTFAGESTHNEMCHVFFFYYPKMDLLSCRSGYPLDKLYNQFGIEEVVEDSADPRYEPLDPFITKPDALMGKHVQEVIDGIQKKWTPEIVEEFEEELRYGEHVAYFGFSAVATDTRIRVAEPKNYTSYPDAKEYIVPNQCLAATGEPGTTNTEDPNTDGPIDDDNTSNKPEVTTAGVAGIFGSVLLMISSITISKLFS